jgi:hypothetical protein
MNKNPEYKPTEGEEFIEDYFSSIGIKFEIQKKISNLKNDVKQYRTADFYLPKYKVYVEFLGLWNKGNEEYKQKMEVYRQNGIPCVYLYPENLGIIDYMFDKRIQVTLQNHNLKKELRKYRFFKLKNSDELSDRIWFASLFSILFAYLLSYKHFTLKGYIGLGLILAIIIYHVYRAFQIYKDIFKRNKFPLHNIS